MVLAVEAILEVIAVKDAPKLAEKAEGVLNVHDVGEVAVDIEGELVLNSADIDVELHEVTVEHALLVVEERMDDAAAEVLHVGIESVHDGLDVLQVVLLEGLELPDGAE